MIQFLNLYINGEYMRIIFLISLIIIISFSIFFMDKSFDRSIEVSNFVKLPIGYGKNNYSVMGKDKLFELSLGEEKEVFLINITKNVANIVVDRPDKNVVLIINSKSKADCYIKTKNNTHIEFIIYDEKVNIVSEKEIFKYVKKMNFFKSLKNPQFIKLLNDLHVSFMIKGIDNFLFQEDKNNIIVENVKSKFDFSFSLDKEKEFKNIEFSLLSKKGKSVKFNLLGPVDIKNKNIPISKNVIYNSEKTKTYTLSNNGIRVLNRLNRKELFVENKIKNINMNIHCMSFDDKDNKIIISTKNKKFYVFDVKTNKWVFMNSLENNSLDYDFILNTFLSLSLKNKNLIFFDYKSDFLKTADLSLDLKGFEYYKNIDVDNMQLQIIPVKNAYIVALIKEYVEMIWYLDNEKNKAYLSYNYYLSK